MYVVLFILLVVVASPAFATDHFNLETGIPTTIEDVEPLERGSAEVQAFGRYLRSREGDNRGEAEPRLAWGIFADTQVEIGTPLLIGGGKANGNGDVQVSILRKLRDDQHGAWGPAVALEADVTLPTGVERHGFDNRVDAGLTVIMKKVVGPHSFHFNGGVDWTRDTSEEEDLRRGILSIVLGHHIPVADRLVLVSDVVWRQADEKAVRDIWLFETGVRAQLTRWLIGAMGIGVGLNRGQETPVFSLAAGFQLGL